MKIEPPMFRQIVDCMDQLLEVYKFNLNVANGTNFNGSIIKSALYSKIDQLKSLRQLFIDKYNVSCFEIEEKDSPQNFIGIVKPICERCGKQFNAIMLFDEKNVAINDIPKLCDKCIVEVKK